MDIATRHVETPAGSRDSSLEWQAAKRAHEEGAIGNGALACRYVLGRVCRSRGSRAHQGARRPPLVCRAADPIAQLVANQRFHQLSHAVATSLVAWSDGSRPAHVAFRVLAPAEILALQARGERCVSLLDEGVSASPHADGLAFALHDLCHLEKFVDASHYAGQVGFFVAMDRAMKHRNWPALEHGFDPAWVADRDHVAADMNGSAIFLFAALKMKIKMAVRRRIARERGLPPPGGGPLDADEARAIDRAFEQLIALFDLAGDTGRAALAVSTRHDEPAPAETLLAHFVSLGRDVIPSAAHACASVRSSSSL